MRTLQRRLLLTSVLSLSVASAWAASAAPAAKHEMNSMAGMDMSKTDDMHMGDMSKMHDMPGMSDDDAAMEAPGHIQVSTVRYSVPDIELIRQDGRRVRLRDEMDDGRVVVVNFVYTTCATICPLMSQVLGQFQRQLGPDSSKVHLISISIDPEEDTPPRLREYAQKFGAGPTWQHYTGTLQASISAQRAFDVYRGDKMAHAAVTLIRRAPGAPWVRLDGFATASQLMQRYREILAAK
jgi:protein SCO1/2